MRLALALICAVAIAACGNKPTKEEEEAAKNNLPDALARVTGMRSGGSGGEFA